MSMEGKKKDAKQNKGFTVNTGNPVQPITVSNGCQYYQVNLRNDGRGKAVKKNFTSAQKAYSYVSKSMTQAVKGVKQALRPVDTLREAMEILNPFNVSVVEAAQFYARHHGATERSRSIRALVKSFIAEKKDLVEKGQMRPASLADVEHFLKRFSKELAHKSIDLVTPGEIDGFLDELKGDANRRSHRLYISAFFNWAVAQGHIESNPVRKTRRVADRRHPPKTYSLDQVQTILKAASDDLIPYLALGFFSGLRSTEILDLKWGDVQFKKGEIRVQASADGTNEVRTVQLPANLTKFLTPYKGTKSELVVPHGQRSIQRWIKKLLAELEIKSIYQGARNTFTAAHLAMHSMHETMHELGCSRSSTLLKYYKGSTPSRKEFAQAYFDIMPSETASVIDIKKKAAA